MKGIYSDKIEHFAPFKDSYRYLRTPLAGTHSSSLMVPKQSSQSRTGNSKPMIGYVERLELHFPHTAFPHFLQWCCRDDGGGGGTEGGDQLMNRCCAVTRNGTLPV